MSVLALDLTTPDLIVLGVCVVLGIRGGMKGFAWQLIRTIGLLGALWGATRFYDPVGRWIGERIELIPDLATPVVGWLAVLFGTILAFGFLAHLARGLVKTANMTTLDRVLGFALGAVMGIAFVAAGFVVWGHFTGEDDVRDTLRGSISARGMAITIEYVEPLFPTEVRDRFRKSLDAIGQAAQDGS